MARMIRTFLVLATCLLALAVAQPAGAIVPPKNCGTTTIKSKRYQIKADQLRCSRAKDYIRGYIKERDRPRGYKCKINPDSKLRYICTRGNKRAWAIKR